MMMNGKSKMTHRTTKIRERIERLLMMTRQKRQKVESSNRNKTKPLDKYKNQIHKSKQK